jgi:uncharacterized protein YjbI with pentapeptide repeats
MVDSNGERWGSPMLKNPYEYKRVARTQQELNAIMQAHERYVAGEGGLRAQLAHANLDGLVLANRNLQEADFAGASLVGASLYGSVLNRVSFYCADLRDCDLRMTKLVRADLRGASFNGAKLAYAVLDNADLRAGMMMYAGAGGTSLIGRNSPGASEPGSGSAQQPHGVDFSNCSMKGASFGNAKLDGANFTGALLQGAIFKNAILKNSVFKNAVLTGVNLADLQVPPEALEGSIQDISAQASARFGELKSRLDSHQQWIATQGQQGRPAVLDGEDLRPLDKLLVGRPLSGLSARNAIGIGIDFSAGQLQAAKFDGADLRGANFSKADLRGASFRSAKLAHVLFDGADLRPLRLTDGAALSPDLTGAEVTDEQLHNAIRT